MLVYKAIYTVNAVSSIDLLEMFPFINFTVDKFYGMVWLVIQSMPFTLAEFLIYLSFAFGLISI